MDQTIVTMKCHTQGSHTSSGVTLKFDPDEHCRVTFQRWTLTLGHILMLKMTRGQF